MTLQIPFVENKGQIKNKKVGYYAKTIGGTVFVTKSGEIIYSLSLLADSLLERKNSKSENSSPKINIRKQESKRWVFKEVLAGATISRVKGEVKSPTRINYFKGKDSSGWAKNISGYNFLSLGEVYQGIELKLKAYGNNIEKLFYLKPYADSKNIKVKVAGTRGLRVNEKGELEVKTGIGVVKFTRPIAYQKEGGKRKYVEVAYAVRGDEYGFEVGVYDQAKKLVIDPLLASTFVGDTGYDGCLFPRSMALDSEGNVYLAGRTSSSDFPTTTGAYDEDRNGYHDAFVVKLNGDLTTIIASTLLGGDYYDFAHSLALDTSGNVYLAGYTNSTDFPTTTGAYDEDRNGIHDIFVVKFDSDLSTLIASTFMGGTSLEYAVPYCLALDSIGNVYLAGSTYSSNFPTTIGAYDETINGGCDVFVSQFDGNLTTLNTSTFLGGADDDFAHSLALDTSGNVYLAGDTGSSDFPTTAGAYDILHNGGCDVFVSQFDGNLTTLNTSTFLGGADDDFAHSLALDTSGNVYLAGDTGSSDFPTTAGAYDTAYNGGDKDSILSMFNSGLTTLLASTFLGGAGDDFSRSLILDPDGNVYLAGYTDSSDFPTTAGAYDTDYNGWQDSFLSKFDIGLTTLAASTYLGGAGDDFSQSLTMDPDGNVYLSGRTYSSDFPTTSGAYNVAYHDDGDIFISKISNDFSAPVYSISGTVTLSGSGLSGVTMTLGGAASATATTDAGGNYTFPDLPEGDYTVTPGNAGHIFDPVSRNVTLSGGDAAGVNFAASVATYSISGTVTLNGSGLSGVTMTLGGAASATATTDAGGNYTFPDLPEGDYTVTPGNAGHIFDPVSRNVTLSGGDAAGVNFAASVAPVTYSISGTVTLNGSGLSGVTMILGGDISSSAVTDESGDYAFSGLPDGFYMIVPDKPGYIFQPTRQSVAVSGSDVNSVNFRAIRCPLEASAEDKSQLDICRKFRDKVLSRSESGREYVELYYQHSLEITSILLKNRNLRKDAAGLLEKTIPEIRLIIADKKRDIGSELEKGILSFLDRISRKASPDLKIAIDRLMADMKEGRMKEVLEGTDLSSD